MRDDYKERLEFLRQTGVHASTDPNPLMVGLMKSDASLYRSPYKERPESRTTLEPETSEEERDRAKRDRSWGYWRGIVQKDLRDSNIGAPAEYEGHGERVGRSGSANEDDDIHGGGGVLEWNGGQQIEKWGERGPTGSPRGPQRRGVLEPAEIRRRIIGASTGRYTLPELVAGKRGSPERRELALIVGSITRPESGNPLNIEVLWTVLEGVVSRKTLQRWAYSTETTKEAHVPQIATDGELGCAVARLEQIAADIQEVARTIGSRFPTDRAVTEAVDRILSLVPNAQNTAVNVAYLP